jgi:hypothetical protein
MAGLAMARTSWGVLRQDRALMVFPAVSFLLTALVSIGFLVPFWGSGMLGDLAEGQLDVARAAGTETGRRQTGSAARPASAASTCSAGYS